MITWDEPLPPEPNSVAAQVNRAVRRQWEAVADYIEAMRGGDEFGCYCSMADDDPAEPCAECGTLVAPAEARVSCRALGAVVCSVCREPEGGEP